MQLPHDQTGQMRLLWQQMPEGDRHRLLLFAIALVKARTGKREQRRAKRQR